MKDFVAITLALICAVFLVSLCQCHNERDDDSKPDHNLEELELMMKQSGVQSLDGFSRFRRDAQQVGGSNGQNGEQQGPGGNVQRGPQGQGQHQGGGGAPGQNGQNRNN
ncbi:uncharacterized protein LOC128738188 [Sabethes cyaneus]|uniref:uncharacterized protein LOC128738188 n=1 Tax=Sabethes cyaneus TaxID=53552 RepID=UPI00237E422E|nr:uncharacterized protein LOC128738188 [Sabethes cyaneus]